VSARVVVRAARLAALAVLLACVPAPAARAQSAPPATLDITSPHAISGSRHALRATVLDAQGAPVVGLSPDAFQVLVDGRTVRGLEVSRWTERFGSIHLTVLAEPDLLSGNSGRAIASLFETIAGVARTDDRLRVVTLAVKPRSAQDALTRASKLADDKFGELSDGDPGDRLYDALYDAMQQASGGSASVGQAILVITRGRESGSHHGPLDVLALSRLGGSRVPVHVLFVEGGNAAEADRLRRLAEQSGGGFLSASEGLALARAGAQLLARGRGTYLVEYDAPEADGKTEHVVSVTVAGSAGSRTATRVYGASDVRRRSAWQGPLLWLVPLLVLLGGAAFLATRVRARLFRLVVLAGPEKGCSYDVFGVPLNLGAAEGNDVLVVEAGVSRNHAVMERRGSGIELMDLNSENGTFVNGERVGRRRLAPGDRIRLGRAAELRFEGRG